MVPFMGPWQAMYSLLELWPCVVGVVGFVSVSVLSGSVSMVSVVGVVICGWCGHVWL